MTGWVGRVLHAWLGSISRMLLSYRRCIAGVHGELPACMYGADTRHCRGAAKRASPSRLAGRKQPLAQRQQRLFCAALVTASRSQWRMGVGMGCVQQLSGFFPVTKPNNPKPPTSLSGNHVSCTGGAVHKVHEGVASRRLRSLQKKGDACMASTKCLCVITTHHYCYQQQLNSLLNTETTGSNRSKNPGDTKARKQAASRQLCQRCHCSFLVH